MEEAEGVGEPAPAPAASFFKRAGGGREGGEGGGKDLSRSSRTIFFLPYKDLGNP